MLHAFINKTSRNENAKIPCIICYGCRNCVICGLRVASQDASAAAVVHHKAAVVVHHKGKTSVHQVVVDPQAHGIPLLNATALKKEIVKEVKGPYGEKDVIGGMMSGGY